MKKMIALSVSLVMFMQTGAIAATKEENRKFRNKIENMEVSKMSLSELQAANKELSRALAILKDDLIDAEKQDGDRLAVKVSMGIGLTAGASALVTFIMTGRHNPVTGMTTILPTLLVSFLGIAAFMTSQGYLMLTRGEINEMKRTIASIEQKLAALDSKIQRRQAELR